MTYKQLVLKHQCKGLFSINLQAYGKLGEGIHKPVQSGVVLEIMWKRHCQVVAKHLPT